MLDKEKLHDKAQAKIAGSIEALIGEKLRDFGKALGLLDAGLEELKEGCDCHVPETRCPDRCVGKLVWSFGRGATPRAVLTVRNVGKVARSFAFATTPLAGMVPGNAKFSVQPANAQLAPGESVVVQVALENSADLTPCQHYHAEFLFTGSWQQCVKLTAQVLPDASDDLTLHQHDGQEEKPLHRMAHDRTIRWTVERGVTPVASLSVRNAGRAVQSFEFETGPLAGPQANQATLDVEPALATLEPSETMVAVVRLLDTAKLSPNQDYHAELHVDGHQHQSVQVRCFIKPDPVEHLQVEQGEAPTRVRAHHFYDHFQCTEPCLPHTR